MDKESILLQEYGELRSEIKQRISQRDSFAVQFILANLTILTIALNTKEYHIFMLLPNSFFYSFLILSSYRIHEKLVFFVREKLEKQIADKIEDQPEDFLVGELSKPSKKTPSIS